MSASRGRLWRERLVGALAVLLATCGAQPALAQQPATTDKATPPPAVAPTPPPVTPAPPLVTPAPIFEPIPTAPDPSRFPPPTVPSAPARALPVVRAGVPPAATFDLQPAITLSEEYTDNFNLDDRDKQDNFRSTVAPGLRLLIDSAFTKGIVAYSLSAAHDSSDGDIEFFHSLLGQVAWEATPRWTLTVADTLTRTDQPGEADRLGLRSERRTFLGNTFFLGSDYLIGRIATRQSYQLSMFFDDTGTETTSHTVSASASVPLYETNAVSVGYEFLDSKTTEDTRGDISGFGESSDIRGHRISASFQRQVTTLRTIGLAASYALRSLRGGTDDGDFQLWNASLFTNYALPGRLTLYSAIGVSGLIADTGDTLGPGFSTITSASYQFARALASLTLERGFSETYGDGENFGVVETEGVTASLSYPFTAALSGAISGYYRRTKSVDVADDASQNERSENWGGTATFSWRFLRGLVLDLSYTYLQRDTSDDRQNGFGGSYTENRVRAALNVVF